VSQIVRHQESGFLLEMNPFVVEIPLKCANGKSTEKGW
jgi:hypothetical protein